MEYIVAAHDMAGLAILAATVAIVALAIGPVAAAAGALAGRKVENCPSFLFPFPFLIDLTILWNLSDSPVDKRSGNAAL